MHHRWSKYLTLFLAISAGSLKNRYRQIESITSKGGVNKKGTYKLFYLNTASDTELKVEEVTTEEACASLCLKEESKECKSFRVERSDGVLTCKLGTELTDMTPGDQEVFVYQCSTIRVICDPTKTHKGIMLSGTYEYIGQWNERPMFEYSQDTNLCLYFRNHWKIGACELKDKRIKGLIFSKTSVPFPQITGSTWQYHPNTGPAGINPEISLTCA